MKKFVMAAAALAALGLGCGAASAATYFAPHVNQREHNIDQRINRGVRDGSLTWNEARDLRSRMWRVERLETAYRHNGFTRFERETLNARLDRISDRVRADRHNGNRRYIYPSRYYR